MSLAPRLLLTFGFVRIKLGLGCKNLRCKVIPTALLKKLDLGGDSSITLEGRKDLQTFRWYFGTVVAVN